MVNFLLTLQVFDLRTQEWSCRRAAVASTAADVPRRSFRRAGEKRGKIGGKTWEKPGKNHGKTHEISGNLWDIRRFF
jgi:hypothetical protein